MESSVEITSIETLPAELLLEVSALGFSARTMNLLKGKGIERVGDLVTCPESEALIWERFGIKTVKEIRVALCRLGLGFGMSVPIWRAIDAQELAQQRRGALSALRTRLRGTGCSAAAITSADEIPTSLLLGVSTLNLSPRVNDCLARQGVEWVGDLVVLSETDLLGWKRCGRETVSELRAALTKLGLGFGMSVPVWCEIRPSEIADRRRTSLTALYRDLEPDLYGPDSRAGLETEVASALAIAVTAGDRGKIERWLGFDQPRLPTLAEVARDSGVSRARVSQVLLRAEERLARASFRMARLREAIACVERAYVVSASGSVALLMREGLAERRCSPATLLRTAHLFGIPTTLRAMRFAGGEFIGQPEGRLALRRLLRSASRAVRERGCGEVDRLAEATRIQGELIRQILPTMPSFRWLDERGGWFWVRGEPHNRLLRNIDKILSVSPRVELSTLRDGLMRSRHAPTFVPPARVLRSLCEQLDDCEVVEGRILVDKRPRSAPKHLSRNELAMVDVFRRFGPILSFREAVGLCVQLGLNKTTASLYLRYSPLVRRIPRSAYVLVGAVEVPVREAI